MEAAGNVAEQIKLDVLDEKGKKVGSRDVPAQIFASEPSSGLVHQVVRWQRSKQRAGTHSVLTRSEVRGGGAKPWRQKGTGRARSGSNNSPVWVGGGVAHGPKPRSYEFRLNKKERRKAICEVLSARKRDGRLVLLRDFGLSKIKTKDAQQVLRALGIENGSKVLVVVSDEDETSKKSLRNLKGVKALPPQGVNVYDVLNAEYLLIADQALDSILSWLE